MWPEFVQFLVFFLVTVGLLKVGATWLQHRNANSAIGNTSQIIHYNTN